MTFPRSVLALVLAAALPVLTSAAVAQDGHDTPLPPKLQWSFAGPFGKFDRAQLQRGFKIYREVCANCHSLSMIAFRNLADPGGPEFSTAQAQTVAAEYKIKDGPNDQGEMFDRPGRLADYFPPPFPNEQAARASNGGSLPPDMSVLAKARTYERGFPWFVVDMFTQYQEQGVDYIAAILKGYEQKPADMQMAPGMMYNKYFPGHGIGMPPPISDGQVPSDDGSPATLDQYSRDISAFLMWTAEPHLEDRKRIGFQVMIFLLVFAGLLYFTKKKVWADVKAGRV
ncbi:MAG: ubiquinol-cytochrome c reductase cytochrome c1 subunit [Alphaproteobacteria bacterium]|jgi:ubiquinol-cytochrome c reductase cytochrome b/c1 subunit|nr:ubiquinol-cytochrome c reductase cytochrome c1 subunit [Alphaproteobacteria bacterium]